MCAGLRVASQPLAATTMACVHQVRAGGVVVVRCTGSLVSQASVAGLQHLAPLSEPPSPPSKMHILNKLQVAKQLPAWAFSQKASCADSFEVKLPSSTLGEVALELCIIRQISPLGNNAFLLTLYHCQIKKGALYIIGSCFPALVFISRPFFLF